MKQVPSYSVLHCRLSELYTAGSDLIRPGTSAGIEVQEENARMLFRCNIPVHALSETDTTLQMAEKSSIRTPYNPVMRQIFLMDYERRGILPCGEDLHGPSNRNYFLTSFLYVDIDDAGEQSYRLNALLNGVKIHFGGGQVVEYCQFERSASQQRQNKVVMVDKALYEERQSLPTFPLRKIRLETIQKAIAAHTELPVPGETVTVPYQPALRDITWRKYNLARKAGEQGCRTAGDFLDDCILVYGMPTKNGCKLPEELTINGKQYILMNSCLKKTNTLIPKTEVRFLVRKELGILPNYVWFTDYFQISLGAPLRERISCGLPENLHCCVSKYAAYRALMMTDGMMVNASVFLNAQKVVVVEDFVYKNWYALLHPKEEPASFSSPCETAEMQAENQLVYQENAEASYGDTKLFDGEGLISEAFGTFLAEAIRQPGEGLATSFQIRMPFIKGVVHQVNFHTMLQTLCKETYRSDLQIQDMFGVFHNVENVTMILPKSMCKMTGAYKETFGRNHAMRQYFNYFSGFSHSLLVSNTNPVTGIQPRATLANYQFLSTLPTDGYELPLLESSAAALRCLQQSRDCLTADYLLRELSWKETSENAFSTEETENVENQEQENTAVEQKVSLTDLLQKNGRLMQTNVFDVSDLRSEIRRQMSRGHLLLHGTIKYLSGDLLMMVCLLAAKLTVKRKTDADILDAGTWKKWCNAVSEMGETHFYAPGEEQGKAAVIDRNPHLTRNEHLRLTSLEAENAALYTQYFGHLQGIVMVQAGERQNVSRLGGADYDGDLVRIFWQDAYVDACRSQPELLPLVIPSQEANNEDYSEDNRKQLVMRGVGSRVGRFSLDAFRTSLYAYGYRKAADAQNRAEKELVLLSCAVGLEIDAVKTGVRPSLSSEALLIGQQRKADKKNSAQMEYFLQYKNETTRHAEFVKKNFQPLSETAGQYSFVEYLPAVFMTAEPEDWWEPWAKEAHAAVHRKKDPLTAVDTEERRLCELLSAPPEAMERHTLRKTLWLYHAMTVSEERMRRNRKRTEQSDTYLAMRHFMVTRYGIVEGIRQTEQTLLPLAGMLTDESRIEQAIFASTDWLHLEHADLRAMFVNQFCKAHAIPLQIQPDTALYETGCVLDTRLPGSWRFMEQFLKYAGCTEEAKRQELEADMREIWQQRMRMDYGFKKCKTEWKDKQLKKALADSAAVCMEDPKKRNDFRRTLQEMLTGIPCGTLPSGDVFAAVYDCCGMERVTKRDAVVRGVCEAFGLHTEEELLTIPEHLLKAADGGMSADDAWRVAGLIVELRADRAYLTMERELQKYFTEHPEDKEAMPLSRKITEGFASILQKAAELAGNAHLTKLQQALYPKDIRRLAEEWRLSTEPQRRRELVRTNLGIAMPDDSEAIPEKAEALLADEQNWMLLPAFLSYCRATAAKCAADACRRNIERLCIEENGLFAAAGLRATAEAWMRGTLPNNTDLRAFLTTYFPKEDRTDITLETMGTWTEAMFCLTPEAVERCREQLLAGKPEVVMVMTKNGEVRVDARYLCLYLFTDFCCRHRVKGTDPALWLIGADVSKKESPVGRLLSLQSCIMKMEKNEDSRDKEQAIHAKLEKFICRHCPDTLLPLLHEDHPIRWECSLRASSVGYLDGSQNLTFQQLRKAETEETLTLSTAVILKGEEVPPLIQLAEDTALQVVDAEGNPYPEMLSLAEFPVGITPVICYLLPKGRTVHTAKEVQKYAIAKVVCTVTVLETEYRDLCQAYTMEAAVQKKYSKDAQQNKQALTKFIYGYQKFSRVKKEG